MTLVSGSPEALHALARLLSAQVDDHAALRSTVSRSIDELPPTATWVPTRRVAIEVAHGLDDLARSIDDLSRFVRLVADELAAADETLSRVAKAGGRGASAWTTLATPSRSDLRRTYARGARRVGTATFDGPLRRSDRTRAVTAASADVRDGWRSTTAQVGVFDLHGNAARGTGANARIGSDRASAEVSTFAGVAARGSLSSGLSSGSAQMAARGSIDAGVSAQANASVGTALAGVGATARVFAGAQATGEARLGVSRSKIDAGIEARALVGGSAEGGLEADLLGIRTVGHAGVSYGLGGELDLDASLGLERIELRIDIGATVGLGVSLGFDVSLNPTAVAGGLGRAVGAGADVASSSLKKMRGWLS